MMMMILDMKMKIMSIIMKQNIQVVDQKLNIIQQLHFEITKIYILILNVIKINEQIEDLDIFITQMQIIMSLMT
ncbi:unnamed protein product [Paramecium sonneborni]|uniref:Uncharacterized protein n=1 Tax=Paramecium sonneborni TaxID=65129 RepID=A0A8S1MKE5_9CILI|nr:unnamed protein product [Paramecium sonneborni]